MDLRSTLTTQWLWQGIGVCPHWGCVSDPEVYRYLADEVKRREGFELLFEVWRLNPCRVLDIEAC